MSNFPEQKSFATSEAGKAFKTCVTATLAVRRWAQAVEFYKAAFGATELHSVPGGGVVQLVEMALLQSRLDRFNIIGRRAGSIEQENWRNIARLRWSAGRDDK